MVFWVIGIIGGVFKAFVIPEIAVTAFIVWHHELCRLVGVDVKMQDIGAIAFLVTEGGMVGLLNAVLAFIIGHPSDGPIEGVTSHLRFFVIILLMELEVKSVLDGAATSGVVENDFVIGIFMIGQSRLIPCP